MICKKNLFFLILFSTLFSFVWSFHTYSEPWIDFGNYFFMSDIISHDYRLYKEYFDHKGPLIFLIFGTYTKLFGTDLISAQFLLFSILSIFYSVISLFISKIINSFKYQIFFLLLSFNILYNPKMFYWIHNNLHHSSSHILSNIYFLNNHQIQIFNKI